MEVRTIRELLLFGEGGGNPSATPFFRARGHHSLPQIRHGFDEPELGPETRCLIQWLLF
jgi:hypothetical protein